MSIAENNSGRQGKSDCDFRCRRVGLWPVNGETDRIRE
jgi:hypothetical protein